MCFGGNKTTTIVKPDVNIRKPTELATRFQFNPAATGGSINDLLLNSRSPNTALGTGFNPEGTLSTEEQMMKDRLFRDSEERKARKKNKKKRIDSGALGLKTETSGKTDVSISDKTRGNG